MPQQFRTILAVGVSFFILFAWYRWIAPTPQQSSPVAGSQSPVDVVPSDQRLATSDAVLRPTPDNAAFPPTLPEERTVITTDRISVEMTNAGGTPRSWALLQYRVTNEGDHPVDLLATNTTPLQLGGSLLGTRIPPTVRYTVERPNPHQVLYRWRGSEIELAKTYTFHEGSYLVDLDVTVTNRSTQPLQGPLGLQWQNRNEPPRHTGLFAFLHGPPDQWSSVYHTDGKVARLRPGTEPLRAQTTGKVAWVGLESRYYLAAILPRGAAAQSTVTVHGDPGQNRGEGTIATAIEGTALAIPPGEKATESYVLYVGPKKIEELKGVGLRLEEAIDYGWFGFAAIPILHLLKLFYRLVHNYGVAIILMTLFIKLLLHPVTKASMRSMRKMQALQPRLKGLREKYKNDRERLNMETMQLFRSQGVNPMGGCLPMLLQIPVYIALYKVLWNAVELYRAPFFGFYRDLSAPDPYFITPIILGIAFFLQQRLTPSPSVDPAQQKVMMVMPVMFTAFMVFLPAGLVIYILVNTLFSVLQQWLMNRGLGFRDLLKGQLAPKPL